MLSQKGFTPTAIEQLGPLLQEEGYEVKYASNRINKISRLLDMLGVVMKYRSTVNVVLIDTYSTTAFYFAWLAAFICRRLGLPNIPVLHGGNLPHRMDGSPKLSATLFGNSLTNIAVSPYLQEELLRRSYKATLIPNSINIAEYPFEERQQVQPNLLWVRSFHKIYNPQMALEVLKQLLPKYPQAKLTMVGPDKDGSLQQCKDLASQLGIADSVQFTGQLPKTEWTALAEDHDIFINTSTIDNMPFSIIEAMALGMIVVSTNVGGIPKLVNDVNGVLVNSNDVVAMTNAIENLLSSNTTRYSTSARNTAEEYDWQNVKSSWINLLDSITA